ncbi:MAG: hypothetical protein JO168_13825 [Solirubrobacterales bacterium]|nr:hypothetical protein [Solirubrobacterales bacterium]
MFVDRTSAPYRLWHHTHRFAALPDGTVVRNRVRCRLPFERLGPVAHRAFVRRGLERVFAYRREAVSRALVASGVRATE